MLEGGARPARGRSAGAGRARAYACALSAAIASPLAPARLIARDIKLSHSVFALPFAVLGAFLARRAGEPSAAAFAGQVALVVACMVFARTWAMLINRLADRRFDAANPRTRGRAIPAGHLAPAEARGFALGAAALFAATASLFWAFFSNPWPAILSLPALAWIALYSYTKRFTALCHLFLGGALAASPLAAAIAVRPAALGDTPAVWFIAAMVLVWVAGFDIIYALQDLDFDRGAGLHSIPARVGPRGAAWASRGLHTLAALALFGAWLADDRLGPLFVAGIAAVAGLLVAEHIVLARRGRAGLQMAFFTLNGVVSCILGLVGCLDTVT